MTMALKDDLKRKFLSMQTKLEGGGGNSTYYVMGTWHFARKIGTHNSVNSGGF